MVTIRVFLARFYLNNNLNMHSFIRETLFINCNIIFFGNVNFRIKKRIRDTLIGVIVKKNQFMLQVTDKFVMKSTAI